METKNIERLASQLALQAPSLFKRSNYVDAEIYPDSAVLEFSLPKPLSLEKVMDELEDQPNLILLYHVVPSAATCLGQRCCSYSDPSRGEMFKVNAVSDDNGEVDTIYVTLYDSLMTMGMDVRGELVDMTSRYPAEYARTEADVLRDFMK